MNWRRVVFSAVLALGLTVASGAFAQDPMGGGMGMPGFGSGGPGSPSGAGGGKKAAKKKDPNEPETHAATGAGDTVVAPGGEPSLPDEPLKLKKHTADRIGSDLDPESLEQGRAPEINRRFYGLYYSEHSGKYSFQLAFPVWANRTQPSRTDPSKPDSASLYGGLYYHRRSAEHADDISLPARLESA